MISEPEMTEGASLLGSREIVGDVVQPPVRQRARRRPWVWALGGAATASALWAAAVFLVGLDYQEPDARGYRLDNRACRSIRLTSLELAIASRNMSGILDSGLLKHAALDQFQCSVPLRGSGDHKPGGHWSVNNTVGIAVALHKKTDPSSEFEANRRVTDLGVMAADKVKAVADLGDQAFLITKDAGHAELRVLDGAVVLSLSLSATSYYEGGSDTDEFGEEPDLPDVSAYRSAMINDMRDLMASLKR